MKFARFVFLIAGIYGLIVLLPMYLLEEKTGRDSPPPITHPEFYYGFIGVAVAFQILFLIVSRDPVRYRPMMIPAIVEKASFGIPVLVLFLKHRVSSLTLAPAFIDAVLGVLFVVSYLKTKSAA
jgi:hypothetical protein